jgi:hypothetical protein
MTDSGPELIMALTEAIRELGKANATRLTVANKIGSRLLYSVLREVELAAASSIEPR